MQNYVSHFNICLKQKRNVLHFMIIFDIFSALSRTQTIKVISLIFFNELALINWAMNMNFNPITFFLRPFSWGED